MSRAMTVLARARTLLIGTALVLATGCGTSTTTPGIGSDGGTSHGTDAGVDGGSVAGTDAGGGTSPGTDAGVDGGSTDGGTDAGGGTNPGADAGVDGGSTDGGTCNVGSGCNAIAQLGQPVAVEQEASDGPSAVGGTFASGTYVLTAAIIYTGCGGPMCSGATTPTGVSLQATAVVTLSGSAVSIQLVQTNGSCSDERENIDLMFSGSSVSATQTCPGHGDGLAPLVPPDCSNCLRTWYYSADSTSFTLFDDKSDTYQAVEIFTRQ